MSWQRFIYLIAIPLMFLPTRSGAQEKKEKLQEEKLKLEKNIAYQKKLLKNTRESKEITLFEYAIRSRKITSHKQLVALIRREIRMLDDDIIETTAIIESLENDLASLKEEYGAIIRNAYKNRNRSERLLFIFSSEDFYQAYRRVRYLQQYNEYKRKQAQLIIDTQKTLEQKIRELEAKKQEKKGLLGEEEKQKQSLEVEQQEQARNLTELQKKEKQLRDDIKDKEQEMKKLQKAIDDIIAAEIKERNRFSLTPEAQRMSDNFEKNKGKLPWPLLEGEISSTFGEHVHPVLGIKTYNNGVDLVTEKGAKARAVFDGIVTAVITVPGSGKAVLIRHGLYLSVYSKLEEVYVQKGDEVKTKQEIGLIIYNKEEGKTELHFEIRKAMQGGSEKLNPTSWLYPM
ncbi:MAG: peptidoglycan DD-metalloendopeptidase family protein [Flavobacteriales bacterium]|nr:peptidoglycan DD-metalloendopeptidase family protein [Flavobacteriales bacterium]MCB9449573.1 peptidoglycan DD-metalloendopeptidase family protein [Flavobacteriales bacterium]